MELHSAEQHGGSAVEDLPYKFTWSIMLGRRLSPQPQGPAVACGESGPSAVPAPCTLSSMGTGTVGFYRMSPVFLKDVPSVFREDIVPGLPLRRMILACVAEASTPSQAGLSNTQSLVCLSLPPFTPPEFLLCKSFQVCVLCYLKFILRKFWQEV